MSFLVRYHRVLIALALFAAIWFGLQHYVRSAIEADRERSNNAAMQVGKAADDIAGTVAASTSATIEQENDNARKAASVSADPLGDGLRSLRSKPRRDDQASR